MSEDEVLNEVLDRVRRLETRVTAFLEANGYDTRVRRPLFKDGGVFVQSAATSISEVLSSIPKWHNGLTPIILGEEILCDIKPNEVKDG
jgi:hypothetical protein